MHQICVDGRTGQVIVNGHKLTREEAGPAGILHFGDLADRFPAPPHSKRTLPDAQKLKRAYVFKEPKLKFKPKRTRNKCTQTLVQKPLEVKAEACQKLKARLRDIVRLSGAVALASEDMTSWWLCLNRDAQGAENANVLYEFFGVNLFPLTGRTTERGKDAMESFASVETRTAVDAFFRSAKNAPACVIVVVDAQLYVLSHRYTAEPGTFQGECRLDVRLL